MIISSFVLLNLLSKISSKDLSETGYLYNIGEKKYVGYTKDKDQLILTKKPKKLKFIPDKYGALMIQLKGLGEKYAHSRLLFRYLVKSRKTGSFLQKFKLVYSGKNMYKLKARSYCVGLKWGKLYEKWCNPYDKDKSQYYYFAPQKYFKKKNCNSFNNPFGGNNYNNPFNNSYMPNYMMEPSYGGYNNNMYPQEYMGNYEDQNEEFNSNDSKDSNSSSDILNKNKKRRKVNFNKSNSYCSNNNQSYNNQSYNKNNNPFQNFDINNMYSDIRNKIEGQVNGCFNNGQIYNNYGISPYNGNSYC